MMHHHDHKFTVALTTIVVFAVGSMLGGYLAAHLGIVDLESIQIGLMLAIIVILLMLASLILEVKRILHTLEPKKQGKK